MTRRDYKCPDCGIFETTTSIKDEPLKTCPDCGEGVHQVYSSEPLNTVWIVSRQLAPYVENGNIHRILRKGGTGGFTRKIK